MKRRVDAFVRLVFWLTLVAGPPVSYADAFVNRNYQDIATSSFPGVTVATLSLGPGQYTIQAKLRLRNTSELFGGSCVFQGVGIGGLDSTAIERAGEVSAVLMDVVIKNPGDDPDVHVQCFGPDDGSVHVINTQLSRSRTIKCSFNNNIIWRADPHQHLVKLEQARGALPPLVCFIVTSVTFVLRKNADER